MKIVKRTMHFPKFNEKYNDFEYEKRTYERPMTEKECDLKKKYVLLCWLAVLTFLAFPIGAIIALTEEANLWDLLLIPICFAWCFLFTAMLSQGFKWEDKIARFNDYGFEAEEFLYEQITQEEKDKAEKWRAEHPFEEAIRKAQETKNCNDIAALLRLYQSGDLKM